MKITFRWYGENDSIPLQYIKQIPSMSGIVSAVYDVPVGKVWSNESIAKIRSAAKQHGLEFEVVESVPVHEDIKLGNSNRDVFIDAYIETIRRLAAIGVKVICYNFMPVFDWLRSELNYQNDDNSTSLIYRNDEVLAMDPKTGELSLPGWDESYTKDGLRELLNNYKNIDETELWDNLAYFLNRIIPVCEKCDVKMAIHPDDPPWGIFGLPRIITDEIHLDKLLSINTSKYNGLTLCTGSLGVNPQNNISMLAAKYAKQGRVHFVHARNVLITGNRCFNETAHPSEYGSLDIYSILKELYINGFDGYIRPDHGRMIWGEKGKPGYGLYDRALGAAYINGLWEAIVKSDE
ncbi:MAG: mannonate dehydratase [Clostridiales bacterium GWF2_38_85]|nr:MAG: mannonate dehydratase [Clostridiales bacterium GWF2_38_85]HBL84085.1 mannonate dehydratase [Clostridiales bacterium]